MEVIFVWVDMAHRTPRNLCFGRCRKDFSSRNPTPEAPTISCSSNLAGGAKARTFGGKTLHTKQNSISKEIPTIIRHLPNDIKSEFNWFHSINFRRNPKNCLAFARAQISHFYHDPFPYSKKLPVLEKAAAFCVRFSPLAFWSFYSKIGIMDTR